MGDTKATGACYTHAQAEYLPEKIYTCKKLLDSEEEVEETFAADQEEPEVCCLRLHASSHIRSGPV